MDEDGRRRLKDCNHKSSFLLTTIEDYGLWAVILWWWFIASIIVRLYGGVARVINTLARRRARNRFDSARADAFRGTPRGWTAATLRPGRGSSRDAPRPGRGSSRETSRGNGTRSTPPTGAAPHEVL